MEFAIGVVVDVQKLQVVVNWIQILVHQLEMHVNGMLQLVIVHNQVVLNLVITILVLTTKQNSTN